jgi:hypothetical protein
MGSQQGVPMLRRMPHAGALMITPDERRVTLLLIHAKASGLPNLRVWCQVWLDPVNEGAKALAEQRLRAWVEQGDINADASL